MLLCSVDAGASTVFDNSAFGERKTKGEPALLPHAVCSLGLYFQETLSERLELDF